MSGGYWNYTDSTLASEVFNYYLRFDNGLSGEKHDQELKNAIRINPLKDPEISGILFDVFCLLHSYDLAESGDASMDDYHKDVAPLAASRKDMQVQIATEPITPMLNNARLEWISIHLRQAPYDSAFVCRALVSKHITQSHV